MVGCLFGEMRYQDHVLKVSALNLQRAAVQLVQLGGLCVTRSAASDNVTWVFYLPKFLLNQNVDNKGFILVDHHL